MQELKLEMNIQERGQKTESVEIVFKFKTRKTIILSLIQK